MLLITPDSEVKIGVSVTAKGWEAQRKPQNFEGKGDGWPDRVKNVADGRP